jgi:hypothetical protein
MLKDYEKEILLRLYDSGIIYVKYCSTQKAASIIKWRDIAQKYGVKKGFDNILWKLKAKGYIDFHGKSGNVVSLSRFGVDYVMGSSRSKQLTQ